MSWKAEVKTIGDPKWYSNALCFGTKQEADDYGSDLACRWTAVEQVRVVKSCDPVNYQFVDGGPSEIIPNKPPVGLPLAGAENPADGRSRSAQGEREPQMRSLSTIAREILQTWKKPYFAAVPYLRAMTSLESIDEHYGADSARSVVLYALANMQTFRGADARRLKAELKAIAGVK